MQKPGMRIYVRFIPTLHYILNYVCFKQTRPCQTSGRRKEKGVGGFLQSVSGTEFKIHAGNNYVL